MAEQRISSLGDDILNTGKVGPVDNFCVSDIHASVSRGSHVGNACGRPRAEEVSIADNYQEFIPIPTVLPSFFLLSRGNSTKLLLLQR